MADCKQCGLPLTGRRNKNFCDTKCSREWHSKQWHDKNPKTAAAQLAVGTIGSMNQMRVMLDLVARGYLVYKAAFEAMPFELMAISAEPIPWSTPLVFHTKRVKVTTGHFTSAGRLSHRDLTPAQYGYDVLAVVVGDHIFYEPEGVL